MENASDKIQNWVKQVQEHQTAGWDSLPEIYLYMDQVITYMERQLNLFGRDEESVLLTPSMINNYVKDRVLPRPDKKKYGREHLAMLTIISLLKQVLSIQDISSVLNSGNGEVFQKEIYETFRVAQQEELASVCERVNTAVEQGEEELLWLACALAVEASARRIVAERILSELSHSKAESEEKQS